MKLHGNARTCPRSRKLLVERIESKNWWSRAAAEAAGVSERTAYRWLKRWREEGEAGLRDRSSAPKSIPHRPPPDRVEAIVALRRLYMTGAEIAELLGMALSTVSAALKRVGLGKRSRLKPLEPPNRYERKRPGELVHLDIKKLGRIAGAGHRVSGSRRSQSSRRGRRTRGELGWEFVHVAVDDATRLAYAEDPRKRTRRNRCIYPPPRSRVVRLFRDQSGTRPLRQRRLLPLERPRARLPPVRN